MYNILTDREVGLLFAIFKDKQVPFIQRVFKALPDPVYVMNLETYVIVYASTLLPLNLGYSLGDVQAMAHPLLDIMHPSDKPRFMKHLELVKSSLSGEVFSIEYRLLKRDGNYAWFIDRNTVFTRDAKGVGATKIGITHEITRRKEYELRILKQEKIIQETEVLSESGSWEYDSGTGSFTWSPGMYRLFDLPQGMSVRPSVYLEYTVPQDMPNAQRIVKAIEVVNESFDEMLRINVNGNIRHLKIKAARLNTLMEEQTIVMGVDIDISEGEKNRAEREQLNKDLITKNSELQVLHSDLHTFTDLAASEYQRTFQHLYTSFEMIVNQEAQKFGNSSKAMLRKMQSTLQRLNLMTNDVLAYIRLSKEDVTMSTVSLDHVVDLVIAERQEEITQSNIHIIKGQLGWIQGDYHLIYIMVRHLIDNAIKFRKTGSEHKINIGVDQYGLNGNQYDVPLSAESITLSVTDNGLGFASEDYEKIFQMFYKNHYGVKMKGSGVGLSVARKIMNIHQGRISAEGEPGKGASFRCDFMKEAGH